MARGAKSAEITYAGGESGQLCCGSICTFVLVKPVNWVPSGTPHRPIDLKELAAASYYAQFVACGVADR